MDFNVTGQHFSGDNVINDMYKYLKPSKNHIPLRPYDGTTKITVIRGDGFINKITQKTTDKPIKLIRQMVNTGTKDNPQMRTKFISLTNDTNELFITLKEAGESLKGMLVKIIDDRFEIPAFFESKNWEELRHSRNFLDAIQHITGKDLTYLCSDDYKRTIAQKALKHIK